ncbi:ORF6N domain-containing protein [Sutcliffiella sp. BMC8]|uniref:ORF6N domain-containing protein n=1 Tax=Sutcliffiella sp. BMC8 TaxID=3073243 RepID=UPI0030CDCB98
MSKMPIITHSDKRILTSESLALEYGASIKMLNNNFANNQKRFKEGKHFICLTGEQLRTFKREYENLGIAPNINRLYLWTEKGAWLHAKSLNTDLAWDAYEKLVDEYYHVKSNVVPLSKDQALVTVLRTTADLVEGHESIVKEQAELKQLINNVNHKVEEQITLDSGEQRRLQKGIASKVYDLCDDPQIRPRFFRELHREIKDRFGVASYKDLKRKELQSALRYIENWIPKKVS